MTTLQDICHLITDGKHGDCQNEDGSGFYFVSCKDVRDGKINYSGARQITEVDFLDTHKRTQLEVNDIVITNSGTIGRMALAPNAPETYRTTFQKSVAIVKPNREKVVPQWLYYSLLANREVLIARAGGTAQKNLLLRDMRAFNVKVPPLDTQRKIAAVLSAYDDLIENNTRRIQILEEMAQAIYRQWFVEFQYPGHKAVPLVDSGTEFGEIPQGWEVKKLGDECTLVIGQSPKSEFYNQDGKGLAFHQGVKDFGDRFPTHNTFCTLEKRIAEEGDILFSVRAPVGRINIANRKLIIGRGLHAIRHNAGNQWFIFHQLKQIFFQEDMMGGGTIFKSVTKSDMLNIQLIVPTREIEAVFERIVTPISEQIANLTKKRANLWDTRDLLLPRLVSGEVDVSGVEIPV